MKKLVSILAATALMSTMAVTTVFAASTGVNIQLDEVGNAMGYKIKGYYGATEDSLREVTPTVTADGKYFFPGVSGDTNYQLFYTQIVNQNGEAVSEKEPTFVGDLAYADPEEVINIDAPCTYDEYVIYDMIQAGQDPSDYIAYINGQTPTTPISNSSETTSPVTNPSTPTPPVQEAAVEAVTSGVAVRVTSAVETAAIEKYGNFAIILENSQGESTSYGVRGFKSEFQLIDNLTPGTYSVTYAVTGSGISEVSGSTSVTVSGSGVAYIDVTIVPTCTLTVNKTGAGSTDYYIDGVNKMFNTGKNPIAVFPGTNYRVIDNSNNNAFDISIPSNATQCVLDLGTSSGVPVNDKAYEDAVLDTTASADNPFNIPVTSDKTVKEGSRKVSRFAQALIPITLAGAALWANKSTTAKRFRRKK